MAMTTKRAVSSLLCLAALIGACSQSEAPAPRLEPRPQNEDSTTEGDRIGYVVDASLAANKVGSESVVYDDATSLRFHFAALALAPGAVLEIDSSDGNVIKLTEADNGADVWTSPVAGKQAVLRLSADGAGTGSYKVDRVAIGTVDELAALGPLASLCGGADFANVACLNTLSSSLYRPEAFDASRSVAQIEYIKGPSRYSCTGFLIGPDGLFLTNFHCIGDQATANTITARFNFQLQGCGGTAMEVIESWEGATFLKGNQALDYALLRINAQIPKVDGNQAPSGYGTFSPSAKYKYLSLDPGTTLRADETEMYLSHHPGATRKVVSFNDSDLGGGRCRVRSVNETVTDPISGYTYKEGVDIGYSCDTYPGSSGSPVFSTATNRVIALHHLGGCGSASVGGVNHGISMRDLYPEIRCYLDPSQSCANPSATEASQFSCAGQDRCGSIAGCSCQINCGQPGGTPCCADKVSVCGGGSGGSGGTGGSGGGGTTNMCTNRCGGAYFGPPNNCYCGPTISCGNQCCPGALEACGTGTP